MTRRNLLLLLTVSCSLILFACSDDDGGPPTGLPNDPDLQAMADCAAGCVKHLGFAIETSLILFHELEDIPHPYTPPFEFHYNADTGEFNYEKDLGGSPNDPMRITGVVAPLATVEDGLQQHDNFTITWSMKPKSATENVAAGAFRVVHYGLTTPPDQTETMRIIPAAEIWSGPAGSCHTEFNQVELIVHHLLVDEEVRTAYAGFVCASDEPDTLTGYLSAGAGNTEGSVTGVYHGATYTCTIDMDTYAIDCAGN
jgi:hypothetical protein